MAIEEDIGKRKEEMSSTICQRHCDKELIKIQVCQLKIVNLQTKVCDIDSQKSHMIPCWLQNDQLRKHIFLMFDQRSNTERKLTRSDMFFPHFVKKQFSFLQFSSLSKSINQYTVGHLHVYSHFSSEKIQTKKQVQFYIIKEFHNINQVVVR